MVETTDNTTSRTATRIELDNGVSFFIDEASLPVTIGRDAGCDIHIASGHVSRHHCELYMRDGRLFLRDTSSNGTTVDDRLVRKTSVTIERRTRVLLADEVKMVLTPLDDLPPRHDRTRDKEGVEHSASDRPADIRGEGSDSSGTETSERRRGADRRQRNIVVPFDRRSGTGERRTRG